MATSGTTMKTNESEWKESDFGFRIKQDMQCINTIYSER